MMCHHSAVHPGLLWYLTKPNLLWPAWKPTAVQAGEAVSSCFRQEGSKCTHTSGYLRSAHTHKSTSLQCNDFRKVLYLLHPPVKRIFLLLITSLKVSVRSALSARLFVSSPVHYKWCGNNNGQAFTVQDAIFSLSLPVSHCSLKKLQAYKLLIVITLVIGGAVCGYRGHKYREHNISLHKLQ